MKDCIFCQIVTGDAPSYKIYEDEHTFAFLSIHPNNPGHTLVIPKNHYENIYELPEKDLTYVMNTTKKLSIAIKKALNADGINIAQNNDKAAGQVIFHSHTHIIPRFETDGYKHWGHKDYNKGEAEVVIEKIKAHI